MLGGENSSTLNPTLTSEPKSYSTSPACFKGHPMSIASSLILLVISHQNTNRAKTCLVIARTFASQISYTVDSDFQPCLRLPNCAHYIYHFERSKYSSRKQLSTVHLCTFSALHALAHSSISGCSISEWTMRLIVQWRQELFSNSGWQYV